MEIGVHKGSSFARMVEIAHRLGFKAYAVDSFEGMAEPGERDEGHYPAGKFDVGGLSGFTAVFLELMKRHNLPEGSWVAHQGWVPDVLSDFPDEQRFGFIRIDLDHYQPTLDAARWAVRHLLPEGILSFHDWFPDRTTLAAGAINEFILEQAAPPRSFVRTEGMELSLWGLGH